MRFSAILLVPFVFSCGPDPEPLECHGGPDFAVTISAKDMPLPADMVLKLYYGGRAAGNPEVLTVAEPMTPQALFCYPSDRAGQHGDKALGSKSSSSSDAGAGGQGSDGDEAYEALYCELYTDGSARLEVTTLLYGERELDLSPTKGVCTVKQSLLLEPNDAGA